MSTETSPMGVLFAYICNAELLATYIGEAEAKRAVERCMHRMERAAEMAKGHVVRAEGEELIATFESADAAVSGAAEIEQRVKALPPVSGVNLGIRIGLHFGSAEATDTTIFGEAAELARKLSVLAKDGQVLTTADTARTLQQNEGVQLRAMFGVTVEHGDLVGDVTEVVWDHNQDNQATQLSSVAPVTKDKRLRLRYSGDVLWLDDKRASASFGRDPRADLVTRDSRASRSHGRIERRRDKYVLIDESTNGTYVKLMGEPELVLRREETILRGRGRIAFGHSTEDEEDILEFEVLG